MIDAEATIDSNGLKPRLVGQSHGEITMHWNDHFPPHLKLGRTEGARLNKLEALRVELDIPHETFALLVAGSNWMTRRTLGIAWNMLLGMPDRDRINQIYHDRSQNAGGMDLSYPPLPAACNTPEKLMDFVIQVESQYAQPDVYGWGRRVEDALK